MIIIRIIAGGDRLGTKAGTTLVTTPNSIGPRIAQSRLIAITVVFAAAFLAVDLYLPLGVAAGMPYIAVVLLGWWFPRRRDIVVLAALSSALTLAGYALSPEGGVPWMVLVNRAMALGAIWTVAALLIAARKSD
jgi:hypothetical protein